MFLHFFDIDLGPSGRLGITLLDCQSLLAKSSTFTQMVQNLLNNNASAEGETELGKNMHKGQWWRLAIAPGPNNATCRYAQCQFFQNLD